MKHATSNKTIIKRFILVSSFLLQTIFSFSQFYSPAQLDSLRQAMQTARDTNKVLLLGELAVNYAFYKPDSGFYYGKEGIQLAQKLQYKKGIAVCMMRLAAYFRGIGSSAQAMQYTKKAFPIFEGLKDTDNLVICNLMMNWVYYDQQEYDSAFLYAKIATGLAVKANTDMIYWCYTSFMDLYNATNHLDSAIYFAKKADATSHNRYPLQILGKIYAKMHDTANAIKYYQEALSLRENFMYRAYISQLGGHTDSAIYYAKKMLADASQRKYLQDVKGSSELLFNIYSTQHNSDSALKYILIRQQAEDSLFSKEKAKQFQTTVFLETLHQQELTTQEENDTSNRKIYILLSAAGIILLAAFFLYRSNRQQQKANILLQQQKQKVEHTLIELKSTQSQLIQSEKMASLGELTAGIAHEIQNPLNFVNNFSEVNKELLAEMDEEIEKGNYTEVKAIAKDVIDNEEKINHHGKRADAIVKGMLQHSRSSTGVKEATDINALADEYLRLSYHGLRAKDKNFNATIKTDFDTNIGKINIIPQDIGRVLLNLYNNAFYAVSEKAKQKPQAPEGEKNAAQNEYQPAVTVSTKLLKPPSGGLGVQLTVKDNGNGIPQKIIDKIFQPFFTTKPTGQGTGLGLSLSYDIIKAHGGEIKVETKEGEGSEFIIQLLVA